VLLAAAATFAGASVQSATGFGFALVLGPALFAVVEPREAVSALLVLGLALNLLVLIGRDGRRAVRWRALRPALLAALPGLGLGVILLAALPKPALQVAVGVCVLVAAAVQLRRPHVDARTASSLPAASAVGFASGALTTSTSVSGPPLVLWLEAQGVSPEELRASLAAAFLALNLSGAAVVLAAAGEGDFAGPGLLAPLLALALLGHVAGARLFRRLDRQRFRSIALGLVVVAGAASVAAGLAGA
jgi:uncharacterized membrane protein YfcA